MFINISDFEEAKPLLDYAIRNANFVALDLEMSGLGRGDVDQKQVIFDNYEER